MKKLLIALLAVFIFSVHEQAEAKIIWDGAEVVEDQTGKMTFTKDVKVYKKLPNGQFESLLVERNKYFRVYGEEHSYHNNQTHIYFLMSGGYRVQATDLVIYKGVPDDIQQQVMQEYYYTVTNPNGAEFRTRRSETLGSVVKEVEDGYSFWGPAINNGYITQVFKETEYPILDECGDYCNPVEHIQKGFINAKNVKQAEMTAAPYPANTYLVLTKDAKLISNPITKKQQSKYLFSSNYFDTQELTTLPKGTVVQTNGKLVEGLLQLGTTPFINSIAYIDLKNVAPLPKPTTQYIQYGIDISTEINPWNYVTYAAYDATYVRRNEAVQVYSSNGIKSFISYKGKYGFVPSNALSSTKASVPSITGPISPKKDLTIVYHKLQFKFDSNKPLESVLTSTDGKFWLLEDNKEIIKNEDGFIYRANGFIYEETDEYFHFMYLYNSNGYSPVFGYTIQKPIQEGSRVVIYNDSPDAPSPNDSVLTIFDTYTTPAGTFKNVFLTRTGYYIAPGYGVIQFWDDAYAKEIK